LKRSNRSQTIVLQVNRDERQVSKNTGKRPFQSIEYKVTGNHYFITLFETSYEIVPVQNREQAVG
jgi:hypothetical protein